MFLLMTGLLSMVFLPGYIKLAKLREENSRLERRIEKLRDTNAKLKRELRLIAQDKEYIEGTAREKLGLTKKGEIIYKVEEE